MAEVATSGLCISSSRRSTIEPPTPVTQKGRVLLLPWPLPEDIESAVEEVALEGEVWEEERLRVHGEGRDVRGVDRHLGRLVGEVVQAVQVRREGAPLAVG